MSLVPNPVCSNENSAPTIRAVHTPVVSLGIAQGDYHADSSVFWRAGISPGPTSPRNILLYTTTWNRGIEPIQANSEPRIWWIDGSGIKNQGDYETQAIEIISRLPERASANYGLIGTYSDAINIMRANKYTMVNCDYPGFAMGEDIGCETVTVLESGFSPSYDNLGNFYNLANPNATPGFGASSYAATHDAYGLPNPATFTTDIYKGMSSGSGIPLAGLTGVYQQNSKDFQAGAFTYGFVFECVMDVGTTGDFTIAQVTNNVDSEVAVARWNSSSNTYEILAGGNSLRSVTTSRPTGRVYISLYFSNSTGGVNTSKIFINNSAGMDLTAAGPSVSFNAGQPLKVQMGGRIGGGSWTESVTQFFSAKIHRVPSSTVNGSTAAGNLATLNFTTCQSLWTL